MEPLPELAAVIVCLAGALLYTLALHPKANRIGEIMFAVGLFIVLFKL